MCLGIPMRIEKIDGNEAVGEFNGLKKKIRVDFVPQAEAGDFVMVHAGFALDVISEDDALSSIDALLQLGNANEPDQ